MSIKEWRWPQTIEEINTEIDARWPALINFNLRAELEELATGGRVWFTAFAPKWEITQMCLKSGLITWGADRRNIYITAAGRTALEDK